MAGFKFYQDNAQEWRWQLQDDNNKTVADSGEGYKDKKDCDKGAQLFTTLGSDAPEREVVEPSTVGQGPEWEYYQDKGDEWRWRFQVKNNKLIADGAEGYEREANIKRAIANVKDLLRRLGNGSGGSGSGNSGGGYTPPVVGGSAGGGRFA